MTEVREIRDAKALEKAFEIRRLVFVIEQEVDPAEEYDEFEGISVHFLASIDGVPAGTCRMRPTEKGLKLERFAVLKNFRGKGVGAALVQACLNHELLRNSKHVYMHAQEHALEFYGKYGFEAEGERFWECEIPHFTMVLSHGNLRN